MNTKCGFIYGIFGHLFLKYLILRFLYDNDLVYFCQEVSAILRLKELRRAKHISQIKMSMEINIAQNTLSQYENGAREPDLTTLKRLADYFDVSVDYLLERTQNPKINK